MIMRKSIILLALILGGVTANAQSVVEGTKVTDNWSVEVNAGAITPLLTVLSLKVCVLLLEWEFPSN